MNTNINNFNVNFIVDIEVKLSSWFCGWIEYTFDVYLPIILRRFVIRLGAIYVSQFALETSGFADDWCLFK